jgi:thiol-disulfide isomerase/thioredoxin
MTRRRWLAGLAATLPLSRLRGSGVLSPVDEQAFGSIVTAHRDRILLVDFWATWCAPCREEFPRLVSLYSTYRDRGLSFVAISCDEPEQEANAAAFLKQQAAPGPFYIKRARSDDQFIDSIDPEWSGALPALFLFDRAGRKAKSFIGETDIKLIEASLKTLLTG